MQVWQDVINWAENTTASVFFQSTFVLPIPHLHKYLIVSGKEDPCKKNDENDPSSTIYAYKLRSIR
jgi:hypothetical protein